MSSSDTVADSAATSSGDAQSTALPVELLMRSVGHFLTGQRLSYWGYYD
jgi:hypothetical protein